MLAMGFELDVIKHWGGVFPTLRNYIWNGEQIIPHIGRGMVARAPVSGHWAQSPNGRAGGKRTRPEEHECRLPLVGISRTASGALRHRHLDGMGDEGGAPVRTVCELKRKKELRTTMGDIRLIVSGGGNNAKLRFEFSR